MSPTVTHSQVRLCIVSSGYDDNIAVYVWVSVVIFGVRRGCKSESYVIIRQTEDYPNIALRDWYWQTDDIGVDHR